MSLWLDSQLSMVDVPSRDGALGVIGISGMTNLLISVKTATCALPKQPRVRGKSATLFKGWGWGGVGLDLVQLSLFSLAIATFLSFFCTVFVKYIMN